MRNKLKIFAVLLLLFMFISTLQAQRDNALSYHVYAPENADTPSALLIALHPSASSGKALETLTGFNEYTDSENIIVVYPDSPGLRWSPPEGDTDDVALITELIKTLQAAYDIDDKKIYIAGSGTGGILALELLCAIPETLAGIAVTGAMPGEQIVNGCDDTIPASNLLILRGESDVFYTREGNLEFQVMGVENSMSYYASLMGCEAGDDNSDTLMLYVCADNHQLAYYEIAGAASNWLRINNEHHLNQFGFDTTARMLDFFMGDGDWQHPQDEYDEETLARTYLHYVPTEYDADTALPVLLMLHGKTANGASTAASTQMNTIAERENFIVIYPDGIGAQWNYVAGVPYFRDAGYSDTEFLANLLDDLSLNLNIDSSRVYVSGISNGGFMTQRLACEAPERYAAFASIIAQAYGGMFSLCDEAFPVPVMMINGTHDTIVPWEGASQPVPGGTYEMIAPVQDTAFRWAMHNNCDPEDFSIEDLPESPDDTSGTSIKVMDFNNCNGDGRILLYAVLGGGHTLPGIDWDFPVLGATNMDINGSEAIWEFLSQYSNE